MDPPLESGPDAKGPRGHARTTGSPMQDIPVRGAIQWWACLRPAPAGAAAAESAKPHPINPHLVAPSLFRLRILRRSKGSSPGRGAKLGSKLLGLFYGYDVSPVSGIGRLPTSPDPRRPSPRLPGGDIAVLRAGFLARVAGVALERLTRRRANSEL